MIYTDGSEVMVDGVLLPGLFKSLEVTTAAEIEEHGEAETGDRI